MAFLKKLAPANGQQVFFSFIRYGEIVPFSKQKIIAKDHLKELSVLMVCGIADPTQLICHLNLYIKKVEKMIFPDHHQFTPVDLKAIAEKFDNIAGENKIIICTEKDYVRLEQEQTQLPFYFLPIEIEFNQDNKNTFNQYILDHVRKDKANC